jgi:uncharacterized membrane protein YqgA involved in biofilm formation
MPGLGTIINVITVIIGSGLGLLLRHRLSDNYRSIILQGVGILTLVIGMQMALKTENILLLLLAVILGGITGQVLRLDEKIDSFADQVKNKFAQKDDVFFSEGFITASIIFCVGPMTILGSINDGLSGDINLLAIKSVLDGFTALALTTTFGIGVIFSVFTIVVIQGGITFSAVLLDKFFNEMMINEMTAVGGVLIVGIGFILLEIKRIKVATFLPALIFAPILVIIYQKISVLF